MCVSRDSSELTSSLCSARIHVRIVVVHVQCTVASVATADISALIAQLHPMSIHKADLLVVLCIASLIIVRTTFPLAPNTSMPYTQHGTQFSSCITSSDDSNFDLIIA